MNQSLFLLCSLMLGASALNLSQTNTIKAAILQFDDENGAWTIATIVRLAFHDCNGGCDGCVDMGNPSNAGLGLLIEDLDFLYNKNIEELGASIASLMSRADFYALCGITAVEMGASNQKRCGRGCVAPQPTLTFKTGRVDAPDCANNPPSRTFPDAHDGNAKTMEFFDTEFGFTANEAVALLGAHTLGRAGTLNSGFRGAWVQNTFRFDHEYYEDLVNTALAWGQINVGTRRTNGDRFQWNHDGTRDGPMMLNSDMCLLKDIPVNADGSVTSCDYNTCPEAANTAAKVREYADDNASFIADFSAVFQKMIDHTTASLTVVTENTKRENTKREMATFLLDMLKSLVLTEK